MESTIKKREDINREFKWKMEDVYADENLWRDDIKKAEDLFIELAKMQGIICDSSSNFNGSSSKSETVGSDVAGSFFTMTFSTDFWLDSVAMLGAGVSVEDTSFCGTKAVGVARTAFDSSWVDATIKLTGGSDAVLMGMMTVAVGVIVAVGSFCGKINVKKR